MVEFVDGATIAQLSMPDMRLPIALALAAPNRLPESFGPIDWATIGSLDVRGPGSRDVPLPSTSPTRPVGRVALRPPSCRRRTKLPSKPFSPGASGGHEIAAIVEETLGAGAGNADEVADVLDADRSARERAADAVQRSSNVRISNDPFEQVDVGTRKAALWTICTVLLLVVYGLAYPRQMKLVAMIGAFALLIMLHETRSLPDGEARRYEGHGVLRRLRPAPVVVPAW